MFDKEKAIANWRARLGRSGTLFEGDLDELESHLRDELDALEEVDLKGAPAFAQAEKRLGSVSALAAEFAKVNPLLAWRTALFWLSMGCFVTVVGRPLNELLSHVVVDASLALVLPSTFIKAAMWTVGLGVPFGFYALFFLGMSRRIHKPLPTLFDSKIFRVGLVVGGAATVLIGHVHWSPLHYVEYDHWGEDRYYAAWASSDAILQVLGIALPIALTLLAVVVRARALSSCRTDAPIFWLVMGCFLAISRDVFGAIIRTGWWLGGAATHLNPEQMSRLTWFMTIACPISLVALMWAFLRFRSPPPRDLLRASKFLVTIGAACMAVVAGVFVLSYDWAIQRELIAQMDRSSLMAAGQAWFLSNIFPSLLIPTVAGTIMLRMWKTAANVCSCDDDTSDGSEESIEGLLSLTRDDDVVDERVRVL